MTPGERQSLLGQAIELHQSGALAEAAALYQCVLDQRPDDPEALHLLGTLCARDGAVDQALELLGRAVALADDQPAYHTNFGWVLRRAGQLQAARTHLRRALSLRPEAPQPLYYLGVVEEERGDLAEARRLFRQAAQGEASFPEAWLRLGETERRLGEHDAAVRSYQRAVELGPDRLDARLGLARSLYGARRLGEALEGYRQVLAIAPNHAEALHLGAALGGDPTSRAPAAYVAAVFDACAEDFERLLIDELGYRTPEALLALLTRPASPRRYRRALDLGAGTGLCGALVRPLCAELVGVDLSREMLARAAIRGCYDALEHGDLLDYLERTELCFDLFVAADSLVYLGDLEACFAGATRSARPGARLALSLERGPEDGHELGSSGRYRHGPSYVERVAGAHGWKLCAREPLALRRDGDETVAGDLYLFAFGETR